MPCGVGYDRWTNLHGECGLFLPVTSSLAFYTAGTTVHSTNMVLCIVCGVLVVKDGDMHAVATDQRSRAPTKRPDATINAPEGFAAPAGCFQKDTITRVPASCLIHCIVPTGRVCVYVCVVTSNQSFYSDKPSHQQYNRIPC